VQTPRISLNGASASLSNSTMQKRTSSTLSSDRRTSDDTTRIPLGESADNEVGEVSAVHTAVPETSDVFYLIELKELQIGTWKIVPKMKAELVLIIDEKKQHVQYRWRRVSMKRKTFATKIIQFDLKQIKSARTQLHGSLEAELQRSTTPLPGSVAAAGTGTLREPGANKRKQMDDSVLGTGDDTGELNADTFAVDWHIELSGPPQFFSGGDEPLTKTTTKIKSMTANDDIRARRSESANSAQQFFEATDFTLMVKQRCTVDMRVVLKEGVQSLWHS